MEIKKLFPFNQFDITMRVDELLKAHKSVEAVLIKNAMKHSKEFMDGMDLVRGVETDLAKSQDITRETKHVFKALQNKMVMSSMHIYKMQRRKKRLEMCRKILVVVYKRFHTYFKEINELLLRSEYFDALNLIDNALEELQRLPEDAKMDAINQIKKKLMHCKLSISEKTSKGMGDTIANFNCNIYSKCLKTLNLKAEEKFATSSERTRQRTKIKILFEMLCKEFQDKITSSIISTLCQHNASNKYNLRTPTQNTRDAITTEAKNITSSSYLPCLKSIFKKLSSIIYSHHCMTRFHSDYKTSKPSKKSQLYSISNEFNPEPKSDHLKPLKSSENKEFQKLLINHKSHFWKTLQEKVIEVLRATTNYFFNLTILELFTALSLLNRFIEIGIEFAKPPTCILLDEVISLSNRYMLDFKETQFNNLKDFITNEEWVRLPLPENYEVTEFRELLQGYPEDFKKRIRILENHFSGRLLDYCSENVFARFCEGDLFEFEDGGEVGGKRVIGVGERPKNPSRKIKSLKGRKNIPNATKSMARRNPFSNRNNTDFGEETKGEEENLEEGIDIGARMENRVDRVETKSHTDIFYQQMDAVSQNIVISSSGLNLVKSFFKYVELINVLSPFSFEILIGLTQIFEFYVFSVFFLYASEESTKKLFEDSLHSKISEFSKEASGSKNFQTKLSQLQHLHQFQKKYSTLKSELIRIKDWLECQCNFKDDHYDISGRKLLLKLLGDSSIYDIMDTKQNNEVFRESIIAVESIHFIFECLFKLKEKIMESVNSEHKSYVITFYNQSEKLIQELRQFIYEERCQTVIKIEPIIESVRRNEWNLSGYKGFKSAYIDLVLGSVTRCEESISNDQDGILPKYVTNVILYHLITVLSKAIMDGYACVRKCSEGGRKIMEKDIRKLSSELTIYTGKDLPCFDEILLFLQQSHYYPEKILKYIKVNPQIEITHIMGLIQISPEVKELKKNELKNFVSRIEDFYVEYLSRER